MAINYENAVKRMTYNGIEPSRTLYLTFKLNPGVELKEGEFVKYNRKDVETFEFSDMGKVNLIKDNNIIGHLDMIAYDENYKDKYIDNMKLLWILSSQPSVKIASLVCSTKDDTVSICFGIFIEEKGCESFTWESEKMPYHLKKDDGKSYIRKPIGAVLIKGNFVNIPELLSQVAFCSLNNSNELKDVVLVSNNKIIGNIYDITNVEHADKLSEALSTRRYKAFVDRIKMYGTDITYHVVFCNYEDTQSYIPEDKEEYSEYESLLPEEFLGRKKNKTYIWRLKEVLEDIVPGDKIYFENMLFSVGVFKKGTDTQIGAVDDMNVPGSDFMNKFCHDIKKICQDDVVAGIILDDCGTFAYCTYSKRGYDITTDEFKSELIKYKKEK